MGLDIRLPIGLLFTTIGLLLTGFGLFGDESIYVRAGGINVNLWWGLVMLLFGLTFLWFSRRRTSAMHPSEESAEGLATEARERASGLEGSDTK
jgi:hypothetical protein